MTSLHDLQHQFAAALKRPPGDPAACALRPAANLDVYRHNTAHQFHNALTLSFPVLRRRVGEDYFRQLAHQYREQFPSRSGDLHWVGRDFAHFLRNHLAQTDYAWLADLADVEWAREIAAVAEYRPGLGVEAMAQFSSDDLARLVFELQPTLQLVASPYPVFSVWAANQHQNAPPVDQSLGSQCIMILGRDESVEVRLLAPATFSYLSALRDGSTLGEAMTAADFDEAGLLSALQFSFAERLVCGLSLQR